MLLFQLLHVRESLDPATGQALKRAAPVFSLLAMVALFNGVGGGAVGEVEFDVGDAGRPELEQHAGAVREDGGAEGHGMGIFHEPGCAGRRRRTRERQCIGW